MLQCHVEFCCIESNVAYLSASSWTQQADKVQRYIHLFVASEHISDVEWFIPERPHADSTNKKLIHFRRISTSFLPASWGYPAEDLCKGNYLAITKGE